MRRALILLAAVSALAAAGLAVLGIEAATAALAVSWLCGLAWMVLWSRATSTKLGQVLEHQGARHRELQTMQTHSSEIGQLEQQIASRLNMVRKDLYKGAGLGTAHAEHHSRARTVVRPARRP